MEKVQLVGMVIWLVGFVYSLVTIGLGGKTFFKKSGTWEDRDLDRAEGSLGHISRALWIMVIGLVMLIIVPAFTN